MNDLSDIVNKIKEGIINYSGDGSFMTTITDDINVSFLDVEEFLKAASVSSLSEGPGAFYKRDNNTVYMLKKELYNNNDYHKIIHEILHAYSNNFAISGKEGLLVYGYDMNNELISAGGALNEAATEYLTSIINNDGFVGYPDDMKYIFELFIDVLNIRKNFVNIYFQQENWITEEMNQKFNSSKSNQLDEFVLEFDNRLPMYRKQVFDFNKMISILLDAIQDKLINSISVDYSSIIKNLFLITRCDFELSQENLNKIDYIKNEIESLYGVSYDSIQINDNDDIEDGKIRLGF